MRFFSHPNWLKRAQLIVIWQWGLEVTTGAGGTNTDSWGVSFSPCLELAASRRVARELGGCRGDPSAMARPAHKRPHAPSPSRAIPPNNHNKPPALGHGCFLQYHMTVLIKSWPRSSAFGMDALPFIRVSNPNWQRNMVAEMFPFYQYRSNAQGSYKEYEKPVVCLVFDDFFSSYLALPIAIRVLAAKENMV